MIIDTHIHLQDKKYNQIRDNVINNMKLKNASCLCVSVDEANSKDAIFLAKKYPNLIYPMVGIHGQDIKDTSNLDIIEDLIIQNKNLVKGIGEIGLDMHYDNNPDFNKQIIFFEKQINLSIKYNLPVSIHVRDCFDEAINILKKYKGKLKGVLHSFTLGIKEAKAFLDLGLYLGINGILTYKSALNLQEAVKLIPLDKIVLETDGPYLSPDLFRSKINEPIFLERVAEKIADLKNINKELVLAKTFENAKKVFVI